jgi:hypothetical protein
VNEVVEVGERDLGLNLDSLGHISTQKRRLEPKRDIPKFLA